MPQALAPSGDCENKFLVAAWRAKKDVAFVKKKFKFLNIGTLGYSLNLTAFENA